MIGYVGSRDWIHSSYGRKIEKAMEITRKGGNLAIVSEEWWVHSLQEAKRRARSVESFEFRVIGEDAQEYIVSFTVEGINFTSRCTCAESSQAKVCPHAFKLMLGDTENIVSKNFRDAFRVQDWLVQSDVWPHLEAVLAAKRKWGSDSREYQEAFRKFRDAALN